MDEKEKEAIKRSAAITALYEKTELSTTVLDGLDSAILYLWLISLGRHYDSSMQEWVIEMYPH